jgi:PhnB protein
MQVQPYLMFNGRAEEAAEFYRDKLGAKIVFMMRFSEGPQQNLPGMVPPGSEQKIMHLTLKIGDATVMGSDGNCTGATEFKGFSLSLDAPDEEVAARLFAALADGGTVQMPLTKTFFSPCFGMVTDKFGLSWMVMVEPAET